MSESSSESLSEPIVQTQTGPVPDRESVPAEVGDVKVRPKWQRVFLNVWWIPAAYFIPYLITLLIPTPRLEELLSRANRVGSLGLMSGVLVYLIWFFDCKFGARQIFGKSRDTAAKTLIYLLGIALWISWLGAGVVMVMSYDQVNSAPDMPSMRVP